MSHDLPKLDAHFQNAIYLFRQKVFLRLAYRDMNQLQVAARFDQIKDFLGIKNDMRLGESIGFKGARLNRTKKAKYGLEAWECSEYRKTLSKKNEHLSKGPTLKDLETMIYWREVLRHLIYYFDLTIVLQFGQWCEDNRISGDMIFAHLRAEFPDFKSNSELDLLLKAWGNLTMQFEDRAAFDDAIGRMKAPNGSTCDFNLLEFSRPGYYAPRFTRPCARTEGQVKREQLTLLDILPGFRRSYDPQLHSTSITPEEKKWMSLEQQVECQRRLNEAIAQYHVWSWEDWKHFWRTRCGITMNLNFVDLHENQDFEWHKIDGEKGHGSVSSEAEHNAEVAMQRQFLIQQTRRGERKDRKIKHETARPKKILKKTHPPNSKADEREMERLANEALDSLMQDENPQEDEEEDSDCDNLVKTEQQLQVDIPYSLALPALPTLNSVRVPLTSRNFPMTPCLKTPGRFAFPHTPFMAQLMKQTLQEAHDDFPMPLLSFPTLPLPRVM